MASHGASLMYPGILRTLVTDTGSITLTDTSVTDGAFAQMTRNATDPYADMAGEVYWPDSASASQLTNLDAVAAVVVSPDSSDDHGTMIEVEAYGTDVSEALEGFVADTMGRGYLRGSLHEGSVLSGRILPSPQDLKSCENGSASMVLWTACQMAHKTIYVAGFKAVIYGVFALGASGEMPPAAVWAARMALVHAAGAAGAYYYYRTYCQ